MQLRITTFSLLSPPRESADGVKQLAEFTLEGGPLIAKSFRLASDATGRFFLLPPPTRFTRDRVILRRSPERDQIMADALALLRAFRARSADMPLATASDDPETGTS